MIATIAPISASSRFAISRNNNPGPSRLSGAAKDAIRTISHVLADTVEPQTTNSQSQ